MYRDYTATMGICKRILIVYFAISMAFEVSISADIIGHYETAIKIMVHGHDYSDYDGSSGLCEHAQPRSYN